jgi:biopolymer transport protein ExbD
MPKVMANGGAPGGRRGGRRRGGGYAVSSTLAEINVVPLVDVMLVLLIIFMVAAPMMQQGLDVNLPQSRRSPPLSGSDPIYVTVSLTHARNHLVQLGTDVIRIDALRERIRQTMEGRADKDKQVFIRSDGGVTMQQMIDVMDRLKEGGVLNVGILSQPAPPAR